MTSFITLLRRELWEHRAIVHVPLVLFGAIVLSLLALARKITRAIRDNGHDLTGMDPGTLHNALGSLTAIVVLLFMFVMAWVVIFYLMDCLRAERNDRSIMFWKSMPVSDMATVFSKLAIATLVAPLIGGIASFVCLIVLLGILSIIALLAGIDGWDLIWTNSALLGQAGRVLYAIPVQALWFLPITAWLMLISAFANRAVMLWVVLPPAGLAWIESLLFGTTGIAGFIARHVSGIFPVLSISKSSIHIDTNHLSDYTGPLLQDIVRPTEYLQNPELWQGLVVGALLLAATVWLRRYGNENA